MDCLDSTMRLMVIVRKLIFQKNREKRDSENSYLIAINELAGQF